MTAARAAAPETEDMPRPIGACDSTGIIELVPDLVGQGWLHLGGPVSRRPDTNEEPKVEVGAQWVRGAETFKIQITDQGAQRIHDRFLAP
jgi:hypothetical protein